MATPFNDEALKAQIKRIFDLVPALSLDPTDLGVLVSEAGNGFLQVMEERDQARKQLAELQTLVRRTSAIHEIRSTRHVRAARLEAAYQEGLAKIAEARILSQSSAKCMLAARVAADPASILEVGAVTQREADLIELAMMWLTNSPNLGQARLAFQQAMQPVPEDAR